MIIYGTKGSHLRTEPAPGLPCPACATPDALQLHIFSRYAHIYWIPFFPFQKKAVAKCTHCQGEWDEKTMPPELRPPAQALRRETRPPVWQWSGLLLLGLLIGIGFVASARNKSQDQTYLQAPRPGDIYTVRAQDNYTLLKVLGVRGDSVTLVANEYESNQRRNILQDLNRPAKYSTTAFTLSAADLRAMREKDQLLDVDRLSE